MTMRLKIAELLGEKFPGVRKNALFNRPAVLDAMNLGAKERTSWDAWLGGLGHESKKIGITPERVTALAPILDVEPDELLRRLGLESGAPPGDGEKKPSNILKAFMTRTKQESMDVAEKIKTGDLDVLDLSSAIDDFVRGADEMPKDLFARISKAYDVDPVTLEAKAAKTGDSEEVAKPDGMIAVLGSLERTAEGCFIVVAGGAGVRAKVTDEDALQICMQRLSPAALLDLVLPLEK